MAPLVAEAILQALVRVPAALGGARDSPSSSPTAGQAFPPPHQCRTPAHHPRTTSTLSLPHPCTACPQHLAGQRRQARLLPLQSFSTGRPLSTASRAPGWRTTANSASCGRGTSGSGDPIRRRRPQRMELPSAATELGRRRSLAAAGSTVRGFPTPAGGTTASESPPAAGTSGARCTPSAAETTARGDPLRWQGPQPAAFPCSGGSPESGFPPPAGGTTVDGVPCGSGDRREGAPPSSSWVQRVAGSPTPGLRQLLHPGAQGHTEVADLRTTWGTRCGGSAIWGPHG